MRVSKLVVLALVLCVPTLAFGQISRISPDSITVGNVEEFLTIFGENLVGSELTTVTYSGSGGDFSIEATSATLSSVTAWIPVGVAVNEGVYAVDVYAKDVNVAEARHYGPVFFSVVQPTVNAPPLLTVPESAFGEAESSEGGHVSYDVFASSQGGTGLVVSCSPASGSFFNLGSTTVSCTATDSNGSVSASFPVFVADTTPPTITVPSDITTDNPVVTFTVTASDNLDGTGVFTSCSPASGSTFPYGTTYVDCYARDSFQNYAFATFKVYVSGGVPEIDVPDTIVAGATSTSGAVVTFDVTATEGGVVTCTPPSGSTFGFGETTVSCSATNTVGTSETKTFLVVVVAVSQPMVTITTTPKSLWPPNHQMVAVTLNVVAVDALDPNPVSTIISVTSSQPENGTGDGDIAPDWQITGPLTVNLRSERSGNTDRVYTIRVQTVNNNIGNVITDVQVRVTQQNNRK